MDKPFYISSTCSIRNNEVWKDGQLVFGTGPEADHGEFLKLAYKELNISYAKFYKMDRLCKLGFVCSEYLLKENTALEGIPKDRIALILANSSSSLESDTEHQDSIRDQENYFASPAVFVYTLPNIVIGEIAIRNQLKGENTFFIFDKFEADFLFEYMDQLLRQEIADAVICGWVDYYEGKMQATMVTITPTPGTGNKKWSLNELKQIF